jgi:prepilin-type N-terminal cleavage/methylation domain-containing protein
VPTSRGFTLVEILVSLTVTLVVAAAICGLVNTIQRMSLAQTERASLQANVRTGGWVVPGELHEVATLPGGTTAQNDVLVAQANGITYRAMRGIGFLCQSPVTPSELRVWLSTYSGFRDPAPGRDSALVFLEGDSLTPADDAWLPAAITGVAVGNTCPAGSGIRLTTDDHAEIVGLAANTPVRIYEIMELRLYQSGGKSWLGARSLSAGEVIQPLLGPLVDGTGFTLEYFDAASSPTTDPNAITSITVGLRGISENAIAVGAGSGPRGQVQDSLVARVSLRNAPAP